ncbi:hypothetical protein GGR53DRAFT_41918 [Hypoxylon sp. FL1150]|nr:hypothetical protein GGR53DRAFT_41918 [Hypoxylon sp. FL1150]
MTSLFSKMGLGDGGMSSLLPLQMSPPPRSPHEHDLADLSPRPDDALLPKDLTDGYNLSSPLSSSMRPNGKGKGKGKGKAIAFAYPERQPFPRSRTYNPAGDSNVFPSSAQKDLEVPPGIWRPNLQPEQRNYSYDSIASPASLVGSLFLGKAERTTDRVLQSEIDTGFKIMQRQERQMQKELQGLIDAQSAALERDLDDGDEGKSSQGFDRDVSPESVAATADSKLSGGSVMPVRQPKKNHMSKRLVRIGIARIVTMLADLKNEEDAYIASALAERKAALSKLRHMATKRKSIVAELDALEEKHGLPIKDDIARMESDYRTVRSEIEELEEKLRELKRTMLNLERQLEEAKSTRDASLSGYKGALKQCDQGISELMKYPGVQVLEVEQLKQLGGDEAETILAKHVSGTQFLTLRPERRTMEMARDWWEGEVAVLEQRKYVVDKERAALEEGSDMWQQVVALVNNFDGRLQTIMKLDHDSDDPASALRDQYKALKKTADELQKYHEYAEAQGWNLLIVVIGAELAHAIVVKELIADMIRGFGYDDGSITPKLEHANGNDLVDVRENGASNAEARRQDTPPYDDELSRSVVRRWDGIDEQQNGDAPPPDLLGEHRDESDNEVPPGLLSEAHHESEDEPHNDVPVEFLSMHSPPQSRGGQGKADKLHRVPPRRESGEHDNEVPPDLLAEGRRDDDAVD